MRITPLRRRASYALALCLFCLLPSVVAVIWNQGSHAMSLPATTDLSFTEVAKLFDNTLMPGTPGMSIAMFGRSVAISGDTIAVGAPLDGTGSERIDGAVSIYVRQGANWAIQQKLYDNYGRGNDTFGNAVALSGDTLVVGAMNGDFPALPDRDTNEGVAFVYVRSGGIWSLQQVLHADDGRAAGFNGLGADLFGQAVAISGDTIVVGNFTTPDFAGAYVFKRQGTTWTQQQKLKANPTEYGFAMSVAVSGETIVVGAQAARNEQGAAYIYEQRDGSWVRQQELLPDNSHEFGGSVAISGATIVVGSSGESLVFTRQDNLWVQQQKLVASDARAGDAFGSPVAISGDLIAVGSAYGGGASGPDLGGPYAGAAYIFARNGATWSEQQKLASSDGKTTSKWTESERFGSALAVSGNTVIAGAYYQGAVIKSGALPYIPGAAYVFTGAPITPTPTPTPTATPLPTTYNVIGHVTNQNGVGLPGVRITITQGNGTFLSQSFNSDGRYVAGLWPAGTNLTLSVPPSLTLNSQLYSISRASVTIDNLSADQVVDFVYTSSGVNHPPEVQADAISSPVIAAAGAGAQVKLSGSATDADGDALTFKWFDGAQEIASSAIAEVTLGVGPHSIHLMATDSKGASTSTKAQVVTVTEASTQLALYSLTGRVTDQNGKGIEGATLLLSGSSSGRATTDRTGYYTFKNVIGGGNYRVTPVTASLRAGIKTYYPNPGWASYKNLSSNQVTNFVYNLTSPWIPPDESPTPTATPTPTPTPTPTTGPSADGELLNPSFESNGTSWTTSGTVEYARGNFVTNGKLAAKLTPASTFSGASVLQRVALTAGATYEVSADLTTSGKAQATLGVKWDNGSDGPSVGSNTRRTTLRFTVPQGVSQVGIYCKATGALSKDNWATADNFKLTRISSPVTVDPPGGGSQTGTGGGSQTGTGGGSQTGTGGGSQTSSPKPSSVLVYNLYSSSSVDPSKEDTNISITNTNPQEAVTLHAFFVDGKTGSPGDAFTCVAAGQTLSFLASKVDPGTTGYLILVAIDNGSGAPRSFNYLLGSETIRLASGHAATLDAVGFTALYQGSLPSYASGSATATLDFDGKVYEAPADMLALDKVPSVADGNSTLLVLNSLSGDLRTGLKMGSNILGILYDDTERPYSFATADAATTAQFKATLSDEFPRIFAPDISSDRIPLSSVIKSGHTGRINLLPSSATVGMVGAALYFNPNAGSAPSGGGNLRPLEQENVTRSSKLIVPVLPPVCQ